jgi:hypothetical protein
MFDALTQPAPLKTYVKVMLFVWFLLLVPWFPVAGIAGVAFDSSHKTAAWIFVLSVWTYPISLGTAFVSRRRYPYLVWLPTLNFIPAIVMDALHI